MSKKMTSIIQGLLFVLIIAGFIYIGSLDFNKKAVVDNERFDSEYTQVDKDNVFVYVNAQDVYTRFRSGTAIVFMGFSSNKWSGYYASILNQAAKESGINEILYYDFFKDRKEKNATYQSIVLKLKNYAYTLDENNQNIYAPTFFIIKDGNILAFDNETAINQGMLSPLEYWTDLKKGLKLNEFKTLFKEFMGNNESNK